MPTFNTDTPKPAYVYDSSDDTWYPLAGITTGTLDGLTDVVVSSAASGQTLVYNGTNWVNTAETGDVSAVSAGTGITVTNGTGPVPSVAIDSTVATLTDTQTLTNKTLTTPTINGGTITATGGTVVIHGILLPATHGISFEGTTDDLNETVLVATDPTGDRTVSLPDATTTLVGTDTTDTLTNKTLTSAVLNGTTRFGQVLETASVTSFAATGTFSYNVLDQAAVTYLTSNAGANWTMNVRGSSTTSLTNMMSTGQSLTVVLLVTQGSTAYYQSGLQIDGSAITPKWQGGTAPSSGNTNSIDSYSASILKVANTSTVSSAFTVLMAQNKFA